MLTDIAATMTGIIAGGIAVTMVLYSLAEERDTWMDVLVGAVWWSVVLGFVLLFWAFGVGAV